MAKGFHGRIGDVDLRLLRVFRAVVANGGFAAAQVELNVGRSTISKHMADLEDRLGLTLCRRGRAGFELTEHGAALHAHAEQLLKSLDDFRAQVSGLHTDLVGELRIGLMDHMVGDPATPVVPALTRLAARAPAVTLNLSILAPDAVEAALLDNRLHVGVLPERERRQPGLTYRPLYAEDCCLYCGPGHPLFERAADAPVESLLEHAYASLSYSESQHLAALFGTGWAPVSITATARQIEAIAFLLLTGRYLGFLPRHVGAGWERDGRLRAVRPDATTISTGMLAATHATRPDTAVLRAFLAELGTASAPKGAPAFT
ncbi:LysR family transcriptional regulator [Azospirillum doebereinerae]|uniref:LysR family transcriptional regulator n=1 Tax=Azospirillum doebereinerae TaxID=92933 RepID=A0A3S1CGA2_9PROT|nr:LysR family transcriptional regulator [Azospirillum doebereinerae]RUQ69277.1 LysR family transcriptional regulator [Azospirillum doebereinerae]